MSDAVEADGVSGMSMDPHVVDPYAVDPHFVDPHDVDPHVVDPHAVDPLAVDPHVVDYALDLAGADAAAPPPATPPRSPRRTITAVSPATATASSRTITPVTSASPGRSPASLRYPRSPVNLPIRSDSARLDTVDENAPLPSSRHASPQRSDALADSPQHMYTADNSPARASLASVVRDYPDPADIGDSDADNELIFDNADDRLPPPVPSPSQEPSAAPHAMVQAISSPELPPDEFDDMDEGGGPLADQVFGPALGTVVEPKHLDYSVDRGSGVFYPAPVPMQLLLPPLLSERSKAKLRQRPGLRRPKSAILLNIPEPPHWEPSPLESELQYTSKRRIDDDTASLDSIPVGDVIDDDEEEYGDSDRATIMSDEDRDQFDDPLDAPFEGRVPGGTPRQRRKSRNWIGRTWEAFTGKDGGWVDDDGKKHKVDSGYDSEEEDMLRAQMGAIDDDFAFTRLDPELVQRHSEMFHAGGVHSSTVPASGKPTSLIEEIEIRKAGKRVQHQLLLREKAENELQRLHDLRLGGHRHPVDAVGMAPPTLLRLQQLADADYKQRREWHQRAISSNPAQDHANETLAQRRARVKAAKLAKAAAAADTAPQETLAQRRERLRKARLAASGQDAASMVSAPSVHSPFAQDVTEMESLKDIPATPEQPTDPLAESPEFDMVHAVATMPSPGSQAFMSPAR